MATSLVATVGGKTANSFVATTEEADNYLASSPYPLDAWTALTSDQKAFRLILAAKLMSSRLTWKGWKLHREQALAFPRWWRSYQDIPIKMLLPVPGLLFPGYAYSPGDLYPSPWELFWLIEETAALWWTPERIAEHDIIPDEISMAQCFVAYGIVHRMLVGVTDPGRGQLVDPPEIKSLSLFGGKLSLTTADKNAVRFDNTALEWSIRSEHNHIYLLIEDWLSQITLRPEMRRWPPLLPPVD